PSCDKTIAIPEKHTRPVKHEISNDIAVFDIEGSGALTHPGFNRWNTLEKTKGLVHLFAHDEAEIRSFSGIKHIVAEDRLANEFGKTLTTINPKKLIIFLSGHGAPSGNFCYVSQTRCNVTADVLVDALREYAKGHDLHLQQVLVVPTSCYNKLLMDNFAQLLKSHSWPFAISFISQKNETKCQQTSPGESLLENEIIPDKKLTDHELNEFLNLTTVEQLINFQNALILPGFKKYLEYQVRYNQMPKPIELSDFGFDIRIVQHLFSSGGNVAMLFPNGRSVKTLLEELTLPGHIQSKAQTLSFQMEEGNPDGTPKTRDIAVNGNTSLIIDEPDMQDKPVGRISVILSRE
ncbi:MAG TPA: hypothetical protein VEL47_05430, partial [Myxococcota bacterium]|nr:hypothetical protein [Myxococcota bacterium]